MTPVDGGWFNKRRRTEQRLAAEHASLADVLPEPYNPIDDAIEQLSEGLEEAHVPVPHNPVELRKMLIRFNAAGLAVSGIGPFGVNPILRAAVRWKQ